MVEKITPRKNEVIFILKNTMFHLLEGTGGVEIDFTPLHQWQDKLIFLERGQYIKFLSDDFTARKITFEDETILQHQDFRVLFKHLVSTGYIHFDECTDCQNYLESSILSQPGMILDVSARQWFWQNPFQAKKEEYHLIFDVKEVIDREFKNNLGTQAIVELLGEYDLNPQQLMTEKLGITIKAMQSRKLLAEAKKEITFTEKSMKEIAFEYGFKDPAYFNRFFRSKTGLTPLGFRDQQTHRPEDSFIEDIYELITKHHQQQHQVSFYAEEMNLAAQTLSRKVRERLQTSLGQLIRLQLIKTAKNYLQEGRSVQEISRLLHFEEPNHFSHFFKHYTGTSPTTYSPKKVQ